MNDYVLLGMKMGWIIYSVLLHESRLIHVTFIFEALITVVFGKIIARDRV